VQLDPHQGTLPAEHSFLTVGANDVIVTALKKAEDDNSLIARYYEWAGDKGDVELSFPEAGKAEETNLMEKPLNQLTIANGNVTVLTSPYEIKTVKLSVTPAAARQTTP
jgi:alpha-mannosidase